MNLTDILNIVLVILALKAMTIGSEFSFHYLLKHGKKYWNWYVNQETYGQYLKRNP